MKKLLLLASGLILVGLNSVNAAQKTQVVNTGMPVEPAPALKAPVAEPNLALNKSMPTPPPHAVQVQMQLLSTYQKITGKLNGKDDMAQLVKSFETALDKALASKDFDAAFNKLLGSVQDIGAALGANMEACKELQVKLNDVVKIAGDDLGALISTGVIPNKTNEYYLIKMANSLVAGLKKGLAKVKPATNSCDATTDVQPVKVVEKNAKAQVVPTANKAVMPEVIK